MTIVFKNAEFILQLSALYEVKPPISKAKMTSITRGAIKAIKFYKHVVQSVEKFIQKVWLHLNCLNSDFYIYDFSYSCLITPRLMTRRHSSFAWMPTLFGNYLLLYPFSATRILPHLHWSSKLPQALFLPPPTNMGQYFSVSLEFVCLRDQWWEEGKQSKMDINKTKKILVSQTYLSHSTVGFCFVIFLPFIINAFSIMYVTGAFISFKCLILNYLYQFSNVCIIMISVQTWV